MPTTKTISLYTFEELGDKAKDKARDWFRGLRDSSDLDSVIQDFAQICAILGIELGQQPYQTVGGDTRYEPAVSWNLGYSQSDFAGFDGKYTYAKGSAAALKKYAPQDAELHRIADELTKAQARHGYTLWAEMSYHHYYGQQVEVFQKDWAEVSDESFKAIKEAVRDLAQWLYKALRTEDEWQSDDEQIDENIEINGYTFREDGTRED